MKRLRINGKVLGVSVGVLVLVGVVVAFVAGSPNDPLPVSVTFVGYTNTSVAFTDHGKEIPAGTRQVVLLLSNRTDHLLRCRNPRIHIKTGATWNIYPDEAEFSNSLGTFMQPHEALGVMLWLTAEHGEWRAQMWVLETRARWIVFLNEDLQKLGFHVQFDTRRTLITTPEYSF